MFIPVVQGPVTILTRFAFMSRLTQGERLAIRTAAKSNVAVEDSIAMLEAASYVDLSRPDIKETLEAYEASGLIGPGRTQEILNAPVQPGEMV